MTADFIVICAGILGLAYFAGAGLYLGADSSGKRDRDSTGYGYGRHVGLKPVRIRRSR
ncbi:MULTISPECIES: hypothetical protein [unclassified Mesorhizobium]|uniref:hypothetical protein n=1 Tax=unclassified Mesorhizobium TaxID=325217 RepID=UPI0013DEDD04|nr:MULTISPECIES: hypothetical protein [unclassified Mesorhizobium]